MTATKSEVSELVAKVVAGVKAEAAEFRKKNTRKDKEGRTLAAVVTDEFVSKAVTKQIEALDWKAAVLADVRAAL